MTEPAWKQFLSLKKQAPAEQKPEAAGVTPDKLKLPQATDGKTLLKRKRSILKNPLQATATASTEAGQEEPPAKRLGKRQRDFIASQQESAKRASQAARQRTAAQHAAAVRVKQDGAQQAARQATLAYLSAFVQEKCGGPAPVVEAAAAAAAAGDEVEPGEKEVERADESMSAKKRLKLEKRARKAAERAAQAQTQDASTLSTPTAASTAAPGSAGWKFSKQRQNHLLRQLYSVDEHALFDAGEDGQGERLFTACAVPYVAALQGASRTRVLQEAEALVARFEKQQAQDLESEKTEAVEESKAETEDAKKEADVAEAADEDEAVSETVYKRALQIVKALSEEATA